MNTAVYALTRIISLLIGWAIAYGLGWLANLVIMGAKWPVFFALAAWWTYIAIKYVGRKADYHRTGIDRRGG